MLRNLGDILRLSDIKRWQIVNMARKQSVAEHSFNVTLIAARIYRDLFLFDPPLSLYEYALLHDVGEVLSGDIPSPIKNWINGKQLDKLTNKICPSPPDISVITKSVVKIADLIESIVYLRNRVTDEHGKEVLQYLSGKLGEKSKRFTPEGQKTIQAILDELTINYEPMTLDGVMKEMEQ